MPSALGDRIPGSYDLQKSGVVRKSVLRSRFPSFLNLTELSDSKAKDLLEEKKDLVELGEDYRTNRLERAQRVQDLRNGKIWNQEDLDFFADLDMSGYEINIQRPIFNTILEAWENQQLRFRVAPKDIHAYHRYVDNKDAFVQDYAEEFGNPESAAEYFDENVDDEFGIMISALMMDSRQTSNGDDAEDECFDDGAFTGLSFLKATYGTNYDRNIGIEIDNVPQNAIVYDEARATKYDMTDISFIGEVHDYYPEDLVKEYPGYADQIEGTYRHLIEGRRTFQHHGGSEDLWKHWYEFYDGDESTNLKLKVANLWTRHTEPKIRAIDKQTNNIKVSQFNVTIDQVVDRLMAMMAEEEYKRVRDNPEFTPEDLERFESTDLKAEYAQRIAERFEFEMIHEERWYKTVFTFNGIFEHGPSPYPHNSHPFQGYWSQYHQGKFRGVGEDVVDVLIAYNKAIMFQELMMAHGAKNVLLVDEDMLNENEIKKEDIADQWTRIGSVIALRLRPGMKMGDIALPVNTVGDNMEKIELIIARYERLLNQITGIIPEQMGRTSADAPTSRVNIQIKQGLGNNSMIFKNFYRTLKLFYKKVLMMEVELLKVRKNRVLKLLGDEYRYFFNSKFLNVEWNYDFQVFEETLKSGQFGLTIIPVEDNPQVDNAREGIMMELAAQGQIPMELAFKYSNWSKRHQFVRDLKKSRRESYLEQLQNQVDVNMLAEIMMSEEVDAEVADKVLKQVRVKNAQEINKLRSSQSSGQQVTGANGRIQNLVNKMGQSQNIANAQTTNQPDRRQQPDANPPTS